MNRATARAAGIFLRFALSALSLFGACNKLPSAGDALSTIISPTRDAAPPNAPALIAQACPCDGDWSNHGEYVSCVAHASSELVEVGLLTKDARSDLQVAAAHSTCGGKVLDQGLCPHHMEPTQCGTWDGVELIAWKSYDPDDRLIAEHCHCRAIPDALPSEIVLVSGNTGARLATLDLVDAATREPFTCTYTGDGEKLRQGEVPTAGSRYLFSGCSNGLVPGAVIASAYFRLRIDGEPAAGRTEARLRFGEPDVVGGAIQTQEFFSRDDSISGARISVPRGALQPYEVVTPLPDPASAAMQLISTGETTIASVGPGVDFTLLLATSYAFEVNQVCVAVTLPVDGARLVELGVALTDVQLYRIDNPEAYNEGAAPDLVALGHARAIDSAASTVTTCTDHLSIIFAGINLREISYSNYSPLQRTGQSGIFQTIPRQPFIDQLTALRDLQRYEPCSPEDLVFPFKNVAEHSVHVPAQSQWVDTGITITDSPNERYVLSVTGAVDLGGAYFTGLDPWGQDPLRLWENNVLASFTAEAPPEAPLPGATVGTVVGKIGMLGTVFQVGANHTLVPRPGDRGRLFLRVNDHDLSDNSGRFTILIQSATREAACRTGLDRDLVVVAFNATHASPYANRAEGLWLGYWYDRMDRFARYMKDKVPDIVLVTEVAEAGGFGLGDNAWTHDVRGLRPGEYLDRIADSLSAETGESYAVATNVSGSICRASSDVNGDAIIYRKSRLDLLNLDERFGPTVNSEGHYAAGALVRSEHYRTHPGFALQLGGDGGCLGGPIGSYDRAPVVAAGFEFPIGSGRYVLAVGMHTIPAREWERFHPWVETMLDRIPGPTYPPILGGDFNYWWAQWRDNTLEEDWIPPVACLLRDWKPVVAETDEWSNIMQIYRPRESWAKALPGELISVSPDGPGGHPCGSNYAWGIEEQVNTSCFIGDHGIPWASLRISQQLRPASTSSPTPLCLYSEAQESWCTVDPSTISFDEKQAATRPNREGAAAFDVGENPMPENALRCASSVATPSRTSGELVSVDIQSGTGACALQEGMAYHASIRFENTGTTTWSRAAGIYLQRGNPETLNLFPVRIDLNASAVVPPGGSYSFEFDGFVPFEPDLPQSNMGFSWALRSSILGTLPQEQAIPWPTLTACNRCGAPLGTLTTCGCQDGRTSEAICAGTAECEAFCTPQACVVGVCPCDNRLCVDDFRCSYHLSDQCCQNHTFEEGGETFHSVWCVLPKIGGGECASCLDLSSGHCPNVMCLP